MIRRINLFAGPGCGKSTMAAYLFSFLKMNNINIEYVDEYVKLWAYAGHNINSYDQLFLFSKQLHKEYTVLHNSNNIIITDSPLHMSVCYAKRNRFPNWEELLAIANNFDNEYESINIFLNRSDCNYKEDGRFETYQQAVDMDNMIKEYLYLNNIFFYQFNYDSHTTITEFLIKDIL